MDPELYKAAISGDLELFSKGKEADFFRQKTVGNNTALHLAAEFNRKQFGENIMDLDSQLLYHQNLNGDTPLHIAARKGYRDMAKNIMRYSKADSEVAAYKEFLKKVNLKKETAMHDAARNGRLGIVDSLIKEDQELIHVLNDNEESPLFLAVDRSHFHTASHILQVDKNVHVGEGTT